MEVEVARAGSCIEVVSILRSGRDLKAKPVLQRDPDKNRMLRVFPFMHDRMELSLENCVANVCPAPHFPVAVTEIDFFRM